MYATLIIANPFFMLAYTEEKDVNTANQGYHCIPGYINVLDYVKFKRIFCH